MMIMMMMIKKAILPMIKPRHAPCREFHHPKMQLLSRLLLLLLLVKMATMFAKLAMLSMLAKLTTLGNALAWLCSP